VGGALPDRRCARLNGRVKRGRRKITETLRLIARWLTTAPERLAASPLGFIGHPAYGPDALRADLDRFTFLPGGNDGEFLLGEAPANPGAREPGLDSCHPGYSLRWRYPSPSWTAVHRTKMITGVSHSDRIGDPVVHRTRISAATAAASALFHGAIEATCSRWWLPCSPSSATWTAQRGRAPRQPH